MRTVLTLLSLTLALLAWPAAADETALRRCRTLAEAPARLACYDALPLAAATPPVATTVGLQRADEAVLEIVSSIPGLFEGWRPGDRIRVVNGQLWQVSDDSNAVYYLRDPKVTVRRAAMGTFVLDIEGARRMPRVRRLE